MSSRSPDPNTYWRRNLAVCFFGSFTTVFAMTLVLPFLPIYVGQLGVDGQAAIVQWSGIASSATFITAGLVAPLWGHVGDRYGRKPMLVRASLGMAVTMLLMGLSTTIWQFVGLRLLAGIAGGYSSGATILIAVQTPRAKSAWALGLLSSGLMAGNLLGPLVGGMLPPLIGIRATFWGASVLIFGAFLATALLVREAPRPMSLPKNTPTDGWSNIAHKGVVLAMLMAGLLLYVANMAIQPIITIYVGSLISDPTRVTFVAGIVMASAALGSILSASLLGKVGDRIGHSTIIIVGLALAGLLLLPQAFVTTAWELVALRLLMGFALGGLLPCIGAVIRQNVPDNFVGTVMGYSLTAQFAGQVAGPLLGGFVGAQMGMTALFLGTCVLMLFGAAFSWWAVGFEKHQTNLPSQTSSEEPAVTDHERSTQCPNRSP